MDRGLDCEDVIDHECLAGRSDGGGGDEMYEMQMT